MSRLSQLASLVGRSLIIGVGFAFALMIGGMTMNILGLPLPSFGRQPKPFPVPRVVSHRWHTDRLTLGPLSSRLKLPFFGRACLWLLLLLVLNGVINMIEALFFTTIPHAQLASSLAILAFGQVAVAILLSLLFRPKQTGPGLLTRLRETLAQRTPVSWAWRFGLAALSYLPIYYLFGMIVAPFVLPYYDNPDLGLNLTVPGIGVILPLEIGRGLLYALTLFPLIAVLRGGYWSRAFWVGLTIAVLGSWVPMLQAPGWTPVLRLAHGLEITADAFVQGVVLTWLLSPPEPATEDCDQDPSRGNEMDFRHISVSLVDGVTVVRFKNLAKAVHLDESSDEIGNELQALLDEGEPCSLIFDFENQEFMPTGFFNANWSVFSEW